MTKEEYIASLQKLTGEALQVELNRVQESLGLYRQAVQNNEVNGYGHTANTNHQREVVETLNQKIELIQARSQQ
jgi:hypothetical protein